MSGEEATFVGFGLASQMLLVLFFAARRWWPANAAMLGRIAYSFAAIGLPVGLWLIIGGHGPTLSVGPLLFAGWALFGASVDVWRPRPWRGPPVEWNVLVPYVAVYFLAQMFMWWPLWGIAREAWTVFLVLFAANTALNFRGHLGPGSRRT